MKKHTSLGVEESFFDDTPREGSRVKWQIVTEYFDYYMKVMARDEKIAGYIDLFAGPGVYGNGEESIPLKVCRQTIADERLRARVKLWFNEGDPENFIKLKANVEGLPGIASLKYPPRLTDHVITPEYASRLVIRTSSFIFRRSVWL